MKTRFLQTLVCGMTFLPVAAFAQSVNSSSRDINQKELDQYYASRTQQDALLKAKAFALYSKQKYSGDALMQQAFFKMYYNAEMQVLQAFSSAKDTAAVSKSLSAAFAGLDQASEKNNRLAAGNLYVKRSLFSLDSIKPLSNAQKTSISKAFINRAAKGIESNKESLKLAMNTVLKDTVYYAGLFKDDISKKAQEAAVIYSIVNYPNESKNINKILSQAGPIIYRQQKALQVLDYTLPKFSEDKKVIVFAINRKYKPLIDSVLISNGIALPNTKLISTALSHQSDLSLTTSQVKALTSKSIATARAAAQFKSKNPDDKYDPRPFEREELPKILSEEQYAKLLQIKFAKQAKEITLEKWLQIQKQGLDASVDGNVVKQQIMQYQLQRLITKEKFANDIPTQIIQVANVDGSKPRILKKLEVALKNPDSNANLKNTFKW